MVQNIEHEMGTDLLLEYLKLRFKQSFMKLHAFLVKAQPAASKVYKQRHEQRIDV